MSPAKVHDPVCGMWIDPAKAAGSSVYEGETIYFCNPRCKETFDADPAKYAGTLEGTGAGSGAGKSQPPIDPTRVKLEASDTAATERARGLCSRPCTSRASPDSSSSAKTAAAISSSWV